MSQDKNSSTAIINRPRHGLRYFRYLFFFFCGLVLLAILFLPRFDDTSARRNEVAAISSLREIRLLQLQYTAVHKDEGFACELPVLKTVERDTPAHCDSLEFLESGVRAGYKFSVTSCHVEANVKVINYQMVAVPIAPGNTGVRAFCADESGPLWYDADGSGTKCLTSRHSLFDAP